MAFPLYLCALVMAVVLRTLVTTGAVTLSADALPAPGGYVVPEGGNITFTCRSSLENSGVFWTVDLRVQGGTARLTPSVGLDIVQVSSPDTTPLANPATITINNVTSENNHSFVGCSKDRLLTSNATILVEGPPNCPTVTIINAASLEASIQKSPMKWLSEWYSVEVISYSGSIAVIVYNATLKGPASFNLTSLEPGTVYNISVIPCNLAGCNESCDAYSVQSESETAGTKVQTIATELEDATMSGAGFTFTVLAIAVPVVALLAITMVTTTMVIVACTYKRKQRPRKVGGGESHYEDIAAVELPIDNLMTMSTSLQDPSFVAQSSSVDAVHVHQAPSQLHSSGVTPAAAALYMNEGVTSTNDITMEDNPAYQSIEVAGTESATMESTQSDYI